MTPHDPHLAAPPPVFSWTAAADISNECGHDKGIDAQMTQRSSDGKWELEIMATWPTYLQLNVFAYDNYYYGDIDNDGILDRLPPNTAAPNAKKSNSVTLRRSVLCTRRCNSSGCSMASKAPTGSK